MIGPLRQVVIGVIGAAVAACASAGTSVPSRSDRDMIVIPAGDPRLNTAENLHGLLARERPQWLTIRGPASITDTGSVVVYQDGIRFGGPESLRQIPVASVASVQFLSASDATTRFGLNHRHGAIVVVSRRR